VHTKSEWEHPDGSFITAYVNYNLCELLLCTGRRLLFSFSSFTFFSPC